MNRMLDAIRSAAEQGDTKAQYLLGAGYAEGRGVLQDFQEAVQWFQKAADKGDAEAQ
ncbi:MAG: SEL1-like repeat protein, partial [Magnetococcales bacterium]|nr:SEL1-like repeat protein [Magnetococcales bacterium]